MLFDDSLSLRSTEYFQLFKYFFTVFPVFASEIYIYIYVYIYIYSIYIDEKLDLMRSALNSVVR